MIHEVDLYDFQISIKQAGAKNRQFVTELGKINQQYARKERMVEQGVLSESAAEKIAAEKLRELAALYADHIVVGWESVKLKGKNLAFNKENVIKFLCEPDNEQVFGLIMEESVRQANFQGVQEETEEKNSAAS